jgi:riboflavin kinase/FMN adenylyltransferase
MMRVRHALERDGDRPLVLAIGFFDGFHRGHRELARRTRLLRKPGWRSGLLTFANHPAAHLRPGTEPPLISTPQERLLEILVRDLGVRAVVVGSTFRFGHKRAGDVHTMHAVLERHGARAIAVDPVSEGGERVSSTRIRTLIANGELARADELLAGTGYELRGPIEIGAGRGHALGFPTANVRVPQKLLPKDGVYSAVARYDGRDYAALVSIGTNPQFGGTQRTVEAWLRDFQHTIYGREVALRELRYVREQRLFGAVGELVEQMQRDLQSIGYPSYG